jgi:exopolysaccharide biosynthesis predicted pyruvyltransferase EpsI
MALAMQSLPSEIALKNTTTGIATSRVYAQNARVLVAVQDKEHVELAFDTDRKGQMLERPDVLKEYR